MEIIKRCGAVTFLVKKMTQRKIKLFVDEINAKTSKKSSFTNESDVYRNEDTSSPGKLDLKDYGPENNR